MSKRFVVAFTLIVVFATSLFIFNRQLALGHDLGHLLFRIDGIARGLRDGSFPARIHTSQLNGYGYSTGIMSGDWFLYPVAALNALFGLSINSCYRVAILFLNLFTATSCFHSFKKIFGDNKVGIAAEAIWMFSVYRIENITLRADFGEALAMAWMPLLGLGIYSFISRGRNIKGDALVTILPDWAICGIAMAGIATSNTPTTVIILSLCIPLVICLFCIFHPKHFF